MTNPPDAKTTLIALLLLILAYALLANSFKSDCERHPNLCDASLPQTEAAMDFR